MNFPVFVDIEPRFRDTDAMGHINNAVYLSYLEVARMRYWEALTGERDFRKVDFILARAEIDFRYPAGVGRLLRAGVRVSAIGRSSFTMEYRIEEKDSRRLVAEARTVQACYDYARGKVKRIDEALRARMQALESAAPT